MRKIIFISAILSILLLSLVGCEELPENLSATKPSVGTAYPAPPQGGSFSGYPITNPGSSEAYPGNFSGPLFQFGKPDNSQVIFTRTDFDQLPKVKVNVDGKDLDGVKLMDVISKYQISTFTKVTILGVNGRLELDKGQLNDSWIITITNGALVLSQELPRDKWLQAVNFIKVN